MMPAIAGVDAEVPERTSAFVRIVWPLDSVVSQKPPTQTMYPSCPAAASARSGMSRTPSFGTPIPACHEGFGVPCTQVMKSPEIVEVLQLLGPPPVASHRYNPEPKQPAGSAVGSQLSFHTCSGM